ncbi:kinase-like domain-containing protein [Rhizophagus clarus]|uniref:Kinase-like domain-containing protein n=1 Tax=Rhizophagus clarus TaxID=94130 RepID=A0A8H3LJ77_9GLOM|nr:kinase-like domain-containing protein [Rhizophagus clarus]
MYWGICKNCNQENTGYQWCKTCNAKQFQQDFKNWASGNDDIDKFIQNIQLSADKYFKVLEWIPYDRFFNIEYVAKGGFGKVYRANWVDGYICKWRNKFQTWKRKDQNMFVALKSLNNSENVTFEFINEITLHNEISVKTTCVVRPHGITQDPKTKNYVMVLKYAENGSLRNYLNESYNELTWENKIQYLWYYASITDMGLCRPADYNKSENTKNSLYGVLPYIAPEILRKQNYTKAADVYSFGLRPRFNTKVPRLIVRLIKRCLDANPLNRPTAKEIKNILNKWFYECDRFKNDHINKIETELLKQIKEIEDNNNNLSTSNISLTSLSYRTHSEAIYTSRLLNFNNLPEPKNSDDYYDERNDNIISKEYSESLQIDISQLKFIINNTDKPESIKETNKK